MRQVTRLCLVSGDGLYSVVLFWVNGGSWIVRGMVRRDQFLV